MAFDPKHGLCCAAPCYAMLCPFPACAIQADAGTNGTTAAAGASNGNHAARQHDRSGEGLRQREMTWPLFEGLWKHKYERERKGDSTKIDPKLIYQVRISTKRAHSIVTGLVWLQTPSSTRCGPALGVLQWLQVG